MPTAHANGISIYYEATGRGPCLTLIHGAGDNHHLWDRQVQAYAQRFQVLTYDVRGHGQTEVPEDVPISMPVWLDDLHGLLEALGVQQTALLGYSMGAGIAEHFAARYPSMVSALILSNGGRVGGPPPSEEQAREMAARRQATLEGLQSRGMASVAEGYKERIFSPGWVDRNPDVWEWYNGVVLQNDPAKYLKVMNRQDPPGLTPDLSRITCPVLIIVGEHDTFTGPEAGRELQQALANAQLQVYPTAHGAPIEVSEEYTRRVLDFLASAAMKA